ncbi:MAG TPA: flagellar biosynthesis protein FlgA, partial [Cyanobacteria bacterium UBA9579]|nr:flagellar biosynthesis protein FlgA [Cyanobacteria bacterium UBA9579]
MRYLALLLITALMSLNFTALEAQAGRVRIKDITHIEGIRDNQLVG